MKILIEKETMLHILEKTKFLVNLDKSKKINKGYIL